MEATLSAPCSCAPCPTEPGTPAEAEVVPLGPLMHTGDVQAILRLVGGAAELWYEPTLQRQFTLDGLCKMLDARVGVTFAYGDVLAGGDAPCGPLVQVGLDERKSAYLSDYVKTGDPVDPVMRSLADRDGRVVAIPRHEVVGDGEWYRSAHYRYVRAPLGIDHTLYVKITARSLGRDTILLLAREAGARPFSRRDAYLAELCLSEMSWPYTAETPAVDPRAERLQPRLRRVLKLLLQGDGEKQVALKLGLSRHTVHEYVKQLYEQLEVSSRGELLAQWVGKI